jgi:hypothetical protein
LDGIEAELSCPAETAKGDDSASGSFFAFT